MNRKKLALLILVVILILAVVWSFMAMPRQKTVSPLKYAPGQKNRAPAVSAASPAARPAVPADSRILQLDLLEQLSAVFKGYRRNIFKPIFVDEIRLIKERSLAVKPVQIPPVAAQPQKPVEQQPAVVQPDTPQKVLAKFTFLGFLKKDNRKTIFLSKDRDIILVRQGEKFGGNKYEAISITDQALTIQVEETGEQIVIPLLENKPLVAAAK